MTSFNLEQSARELTEAIAKGPRHVRFRLPEPVLASPDREKTAGAWLSHGTAESSVMMQIPSVGAFVRALPH